MRYTRGTEAAMRSIVISRFGEPSQVLAVAEGPPPEPGPGQVRLTMVQSPIHNHDLAMVRGIYGQRPALPAVPGTEALAVVDRPGPGVEPITVGQRVCVAGVMGTWAEAFLAPARALVPVPPGLDDDVACQLLAMPLSAVMLLEDLALAPGQWLIQNAASGAVGRLIDRLARARGLHVVNLVRRQDAVAALRAVGVEHVLSTDAPGWQARVPELTGGAPVLRAVDSVGGRASSELLAVLGAGGVLITFGALSGQPMALDPGPLIFKEITVKGYWATRRTEQIPVADRVRMVGEVLGHAAAGRLPLTVDSRFDLAQATEAAAASERPGRGGKVVFRARMT
jgi:NADPH2:quinone reductase